MKQSRILILVLFCISISGRLDAQELYFTKEGKISFLSETRLERIYAEAADAHSFLNIKTGEVAFSVNISSFQFRIKLMQEHFNENFMESSTYPRATFTGFIENIEKFDFNSTSAQSFNVNGKMTIRGVAQEITTPVRLLVKGNTLFSGDAEFRLKPEDYKVKIPSVVGRKIAKEIVVTVRSDYQPYIP